MQHMETSEYTKQIGEIKQMFVVGLVYSVHRPVVLDM